MSPGSEKGTEMPDSDTLIIIPAYNEAQRIGQTLDDLSTVSSQLRFDVLVIDDGSTDATEEVVREAGYPVIRLLFHSGYGTALQTGYKYADLKGYEYIVQVDADGQHDVRFLPTIVDMLKKNRMDIAVGSRFLDGTPFSPLPNRVLYYGTPLRRIGIRLFRLLLSLWGLKVTDPTSGFLGLQRSAFTFLAGDVFPFDYPDADVLLLLHRNKFRIQEVPVFMYLNPERGTIHRGCAPFWYMIKESLSLIFAGLRPREIA